MNRSSWVCGALRASIGLVASCVAGCYSTGEGPDPPASALYFPVGLAVSPGGHVLYVGNSDFDLQFNSGTVEAYDLDGLRSYLRDIWDPPMPSSDPCTPLGLPPNTTPILYPGPCGSLNIAAPPPEYAAKTNSSRIVMSSARIGAFATDMVFVCHPSDDLTQSRADCGGTGAAGMGATSDGRGARLFVPVRGDPSLTFFDVDDDRKGGGQTFRLDCGQAANSGRCSDAHRVGQDANDNTRGLTLPPEPFGIAVSDRADALVMSHQIPGGAVSLVTGFGTNGASVLDVKPRLEYVIGGLPAPATGITSLPIAAVVPATGSLTNYQEGFVVTYRGAAEADIFRLFDDRTAAPARPFLSRVSAFGLAATPNGIDSRGIAIDRSEQSDRVACETKCRDNGADVPCLTACTVRPLSVFVANRAPPALLIGDVTTPSPTGSSDAILFYDSVPLAPGPSRVVVGRIRSRFAPYDYEPRVFVVCFDARAIFVYDPIRRRLDGEIRTGRGPHALVMDPVEAIAYVGHFTDSYIGVIDLDQSHPSTFESIVATIGVPQPPRESK